MAQFRIPESWEGRTLKEIRDQTGAPFRADVLAAKLGVDENTKLSRGQSYNIDTSDSGSGEIQFVTKNFEQVTAEQIAKEFADATLKAAQKTIDEEVKFLKDYDTNNPFAFDEMLARQSATQQYEPYYSELLQDYVTNIDLKRQTTQDEQKLTQDLYKLDTGARSRAYDRAVGQAEEGFAGQGMFFSGLKYRTTGQQEVEFKSDVKKAAEQYATGQAGFGRQLQGYDIAQGQQTRDIGREQQTAIESGILQRRQEAIQPYLYGRETAYKRQFPTQGDPMAGYYIPENLRY